MMKRLKRSSMHREETRSPRRHIYATTCSLYISRRSLSVQDCIASLVSYLDGIVPLWEMSLLLLLLLTDDLLLLWR